MGTVAKIILYPVFALLTFMVFLVFLFPYGSLKDKIINEINNNLGGQYEVSIGDFSPGIFSKTRLKNISLSSKGSAGEVNLLSFEKFDIDVGLLSLMMGRLQMSFEAAHGKSSLSGTTHIQKSYYSIQMSLKNFDMDALRVLKDLYNLDLSGQLSGKINLEIFPLEPLRNKGMVDIHIGSLKLEKSNIMNLLEFPAMELAASQDSGIRLDIRNGNIQVQKVSLTGSDLDFKMKGKIYFSRQVSNYRLNLRGKFQFPATITPKLPFLMLIDQQKGPDGSYPLTITGRMAQPNIQIGEFKLPI